MSDTTRDREQSQNRESPIGNLLEHAQRVQEEDREGNWSIKVQIYQVAEESMRERIA